MTIILVVVSVEGPGSDEHQLQVVETFPLPSVGVVVLGRQPDINVFRRPPLDLLSEIQESSLSGPGPMEDWSGLAGSGSQVLW